MTGLIDKLKKLLSKQKAKTAKSHSANLNVPNSNVTSKAEIGLTPEAVVNLMQQLEATNEGQYSCAESYALLDEYVEHVASNEEAERIMPLVKAHLDACPDCHQEFEILLDILKGDD